MVTGAQKTAARSYLGYPNIYRDMNTRLESTFAELDADAEAQFDTLLTAIAAADAALQLAITGGGSVKKVDEIEYFGPSQFQLDTVGQARKRARELVGRLSILLGVPIYSDYFGEGGYLGDNFSAGGMPGGGGGNGGAFSVG